MSHSGAGLRGVVASKAYIAPAAALGVATFLALASLPPFETGYWTSAEPLVIAYHGAAALAALALAGAGLLDPGRLQAVLRHPLVLLAGGLALWTCIAAPFAAEPWVSVYGPPQSGQGGLWFLGVALLIACGLWVRDNARAWRALVVVAIAAGAATAAVKAWDALAAEALLIRMPPYYAFPGLVLPFIAMVHADDRFGRLRVIVAVLVGAALIGLSENRTAMGLAALAAILFAVHRASAPGGTLRRLLQGRGFAGLAVGAAVVSPPILVQTLSESWVPASIRSRRLIADIMVAAQPTDLWSLLSGRGWGQTQNAFFRYLNAAGQTNWQTEWGFLNRDVFHSHNWALESLYAAGVPGLVLAVAWLAVLPFVVPEARRFAATVLAASYIALLGLWFELAFALPFVALAAAGLSGGVRALPTRAHGSSQALVGLLVLAAAWHGVTAGRLARFAGEVDADKAAYAAPAEVRAPPIFPTGVRESDLALALFLGRHLIDLGKFGDLTDPALRQRARPTVDWMIAEIVSRAPRTRTPALVMAGVSLISEAAYSPSMAWLRDEVEGWAPLWAAWVDRLLTMAPERSDVAIPYLTWLLERGRTGPVGDMVARILDHDPDDPVGLYYRGAVAALSDDPAIRRRGLADIAAALDHGIERHLSVPDWLKAAAEAVAPGRGR